MFRRLRPRSRALVATTALGLVASPLAVGSAQPAAANPAGTGLVISEVYGGGGNSGALFRSDFIELYNPSSGDLPLDGLTLQYRSTSGGAGASVALSGTVEAGEHYLVKAADGGNTALPALPAPDDEFGATMSGSGGQVLLINGTSFTGTGDVAGNPALVDMVGWNSSSNTYEGSRAPATSNSTSVARTALGVDTDVNGNDFTAGAPTPTNAAGETAGAACDAEETIADIQGSGAASPCVGGTVTTQGVVTAVYPTGGFNGFFLQTGGTGGGTDATPGASDAVFVYGGSGGLETYPALGDSVEVTGQVVEFGGLTEITATTVTGIADLPPVTPLPFAFPPAAADKEAHEGELVAPQGPFTVTNAFTINQYAEVGLAAGTTPLRQPSDVAAPGTPEADAVVADNAARRVALDDGASIDFIDTDSDNDDVPDKDNWQIPLPWLTPERSIRVGASVSFTAPVVLDYRNGTWKFQPQQRVEDDGSDVATFEDTRPENLQPQDVGGDLKLATFNVLNYFNTTGEAFDDRAGTTCTFYTDRTDLEPVAVNSCNPNGPRGAADRGDLNRQQAKIVRAINAMDADIVSLEEIENSVKLVGETNRDDAVAALVGALNAAAGERRWAYAPSPPASELPALAEQDVIRNAFIYDPSTVSRVGASKVLVGSAAFANAREPLAQAFKPAGTGDADGFAVVVNHFKSKSCSGASGDNADDGYQGCFNGDRVRQAEALATFADAFAEERGVEEVFLTGDFNSYTQEDPMQVLYEAGFGVVESDTEGEYSYSFSGLSGSLDHVLANTAAREMVTGADIWEINANEPVAYQYSRFNYNPTQFFDRTDPFAASDHNPEVVGLDVAAAQVEVQILATNDFHGRILNNTSGSEAGAAVLSGAVKQLRRENPNTVFAAAGDLIGASTFESFIQQDKPTIDALNEAGLEVSAVGNHEFDQGYDDLVNRVMAPYDPETNPYGGAEWEYLGENVKFVEDGSDALDGTWVKEMNGVQVGFVGAVTEHLDELVAPDGIEEIEVQDIVTATNRAAGNLKRQEGADLVVLLVHEGAPNTSCETFDDDPTSDFGSIVTGVNANVDAIVSGHTHLAYNCSFPVPAWVDAGRPVTERPVVSAGQYGINLNQLKFSVDPVTGQVQSKSQEILPLKADAATPNYPADPAVAEIVQDAVEVAAVEGAKRLGEIEAPFSRAKFTSGAENRGGESTLGNLVAEIQRWATSSPTTGSAQIAFMNPGGLRADLVGTVTGEDRIVTYRQAAEVQPFANTLVNMDLTGEQIERVLEEQWQAPAASRPFLKLGISKGFEYTYTPPPAGSPVGTKGEVTGMWLDGEPVVDTQTYSVTVNSFLASGGDGFATLAEGAGKQDTGQTDLQAQVAYMAEFASESPLEVDYSQRSVGVVFPAGAPAEYAPGAQVSFDLSSLSMTGPDDVRDTAVTVRLGEAVLGTFPVTTTVQAGVPGADEAGTASVTVTLPAGVPSGAAELLVEGNRTGTSVPVAIQVAGGQEPDPEKVDPTITTTHRPQPVRQDRTQVDLVITVRAPGVTPTGWVTVKVTGKGERTRRLVDGRVVFELGRFAEPGKKTVRVSYAGNARVNAGRDTHTFWVKR